MTTVEFTSDVVRSTKFREKMRGYHAEEVDAFLERTAVAIEQLQTRLAEITERALKAESANESNSEADESIRRTLTLAQRTAEMAVKEANDEAQRIRAEAQADADRQRAESEDTCHQLMADATTEADSLRSSAEENLAAATAAAAAMVAEAERDAEDQRSDSEQGIAVAERESAAGIANAERASAEGIAHAERESAEGIAHAEREHTERMATSQREADEEMASKAEAAERELEAIVASLSAQRAELRDQVEALALYLATERARVLDSLTTATAEFEQSLTPSPQPSLVLAAVSADVAEAQAQNEGMASTYAPGSPWAPMPAETHNDLGISNEDAVADGPATVSSAPAADAGDSEPEDAGAVAWGTDMSTLAAAWQAGEESVGAAEDGVAPASDQSTDALMVADPGAGEQTGAVAPGDEAEVVIDEPVQAENGNGDGMPDAPFDYSAHEATEEAVPSHHDETAPSSLMFTLEDEMRREAAREVTSAVETKPRKTLLGRRRG